MRIQIFILAVALIASPALALNVYLEREGTSTNPAVVAVKYSGADSANLPRTFALKIQLNNQAYIDDVTDYKTNGISTAGSPGYGIYPATIVIDSSGSVTAWGSPIAAPGDPGSSTGIDTNSIVLEFGSLYFGDANAPATSGTLCKLSIVQNGATPSSTISMVDEDTYRGGLILEDYTTGDVNTAGVVITWGTAPDPATNGTPTGTCIAVTTDLSWTAGSGATSHDIYFGTSLPGTPTNVTTTTFDTGTMANGTTYLCRVVERNAIGTSAALDWSFTTIQASPGAATIVSPSNNATGQSRAGVTLTWTAGSGAASHDVYFGTNSTSPASKGNQTATTYATGTLIQGVSYYWKIDEKNACGTTTTGTIWNFRVEECLKSTATEYAAWVDWSRPSCWCFKRQCRGDLNGTKNIYWVTLADWNMFKSCFNMSDSAMRGTNCICADLNHIKNVYRVSLADFNIFKMAYNKGDTSARCCDLDMNCTLAPEDKWNFWMN